MHICIFFCLVFCSFSLSLYILLNKASNNCSIAPLLHCLKTPFTKQLSSLVFNLASFMFSGHKAWPNPLPNITWMFYCPVDSKVLSIPWNEMNTAFSVCISVGILVFQTSTVGLSSSAYCIPEFLNSIAPTLFNILSIKRVQNSHISHGKSLSHKCLHFSIPNFYTSISSLCCG